MASLEVLCADIVKRHPIAPRRVLGHADISPSRKRDPGEFFDWRRLAAKGIGLWPKLRAPQRAGAALGPSDSGVRVAAAQSALAAFGYGLSPTGEYDAATVDVVVAFQRHFRPRIVDGALDPETDAILRSLLRMVT
jgi:N-acetylmuramoyl-L-alanine amidase